MKVGDRVEIISSPYMGSQLQPGQRGEVLSINGKGRGSMDKAVAVELDNGHRDVIGEPFNFFEEELKVIQEA